MVERMNQNMIEVLNDFRKMKIECDKEHYSFISYKLNQLIEKYEALMLQREEIQEKYFQMMEDITDNDIDIKIDYGRWDKIRLNEKAEWNYELNQIINLKHDIDVALKLLKSGEIEKILIEEEEQLTGDKLS